MWVSFSVAGPTHPSIPIFRGGGWVPPPAATPLSTGAPVLYVTPEKYRTMAVGIDLEGIEDVEVASVLDRAATVAESYCTVPRFPAQHSFFGGSVVGEQHDWLFPESPLEAPRPRIWPYHWPITSVTDFKVKVTNTQYVTIAPTELFINNADRYIEVVSLAFTG